MKIDVLIWLMFAHWVADFVLQSDWMAKGKAKDNLPLMVHCLIYGTVLGIAAQSYVFGVVVGFIHVLVDYPTSRINSRLWAAGRVHDFFVSVGLDQFLHFATIVLAYQLLFGLN